MGGLVHAPTVLRVLGLVFFGVALAALTVGVEAEPSPRDALAAATPELLLAEARILDASYRKSCHELLGVPAPPCLTLRFDLDGSAEARATAVLGRAGASWQVADDRVGDGRTLRLRCGDVRAEVVLRSPSYRGRCPELLERSTCDDRIHVEVSTSPSFRARAPQFPRRRCSTRWRPSDCARRRQSPSRTSTGPSAR